MGCELVQEAEWWHKRSIDWESLANPNHHGVSFFFNRVLPRPGGPVAGGRHRAKRAGRSTPTTSTTRRAQLHPLGRRRPAAGLPLQLFTSAARPRTGSGCRRSGTGSSCGTPTRRSTAGPTSATWAWSRPRRWSGTASRAPARVTLPPLATVWLAPEISPVGRFSRVQAPGSRPTWVEGGTKLGCGRPTSALRWPCACDSVKERVAGAVEGTRPATTTCWSWTANGSGPTTVPAPRRPRPQSRLVDLSRGPASSTSCTAAPSTPEGTFDAAAGVSTTSSSQGAARTRSRSCRWAAFPGNL